MEGIRKEIYHIFQHYVETLPNKIRTQKRSTCLLRPISFIHKIKKYISAFLTSA